VVLLKIDSPDLFVNSLGLYSDGSSAFVEITKGGSDPVLKVSFRLVSKGQIKKAWVRISPDGERQHIVMTKTSHGIFERWEGFIPCKWKRIEYRFEMLLDNGMLYFDQEGVHKVPPFDVNHFVWLNRPSPAGWLEGTTFYQIFPDRFCRSEKDRFSSAPLENAYGKEAQLREWGSKLRTFEQCGSMDFYGGDLPGIEEKVDYLADLGIGGIYLNPIFHAPSNHRYDTQDYRNVDPRLGTNDDFAHLVKVLHSRGIKVILDAVFNHVGTAHRWFNKEGFYKESGAWQSRNSPWAEFFTFYEHPHQYDCWLGVDSLPVLDFRSQSLRDEFYRSENSIGAQWLKAPYDIDGYRFDVANMMARNGQVQLHREVWAELSDHLKKIKPHIYLMGEHFFDPASLIDGTGLDGVMNYHGFTHPVIRWLTQREPLPPRDFKEDIPVDYSATDLAEALHLAAARAPFAIQSGQYNLLGSHDTPRILNFVRENEKLAKLGAQFLFTWPGTAGVYYGDEIGFSGGNDPFCRECMEWDDKLWKTEFRDLYKKLIRLKKDQPALAKGGYRILEASGSLFIFARIFDNEVIISAMNSGSKICTGTIDLTFTGKKRGVLQSLLFDCSSIGGFTDGSSIKIENFKAVIKVLPESGNVYKLQ
jgi:alpha-glucosidase